MINLNAFICNQKAAYFAQGGFLIVEGCRFMNDK